MGYLQFASQMIHGSADDLIRALKHALTPYTSSTYDNGYTEVVRDDGVPSTAFNDEPDIPAVFAVLKVEGIQMRVVERGKFSSRNVEKMRIVAKRGALTVENIETKESTSIRVSEFDSSICRRDNDFLCEMKMIDNEKFIEFRVDPSMTGPFYDAIEHVWNRKMVWKRESWIEEYEKEMKQERENTAGDKKSGDAETVKSSGPVARSKRITAVDSESTAKRPRVDSDSCDGEERSKNDRVIEIRKKMEETAIELSKLNREEREELMKSFLSMVDERVEEEKEEDDLTGAQKFRSSTREMNR
ncbi:hypothetical protein PFISCL1PPCAC_10907 [Pristionchus fissidentatus]|uniref:Uncharacterized protein n=1 Tax=Pristionchus fissidentatus TaxID=1538716 RepID=A0AAV5VIW2_9BILA|nr:hypothetical protein PFISCL1PPCAC_10907 [Pristionchus fissidentatus]